MNQAEAGIAIQYVGFWARVGAAIIDTIVMVLVFTPVFAVLGLGSGIEKDDQGMPVLPPDYWNKLAVQQLIAAAAIVAFWAWRMATPGKMLIGAVIVDAGTFGKPGTGRFVLRYLAYFVSTIPLGLGLLWVGWDRRKQGWHDKIANTVVVRKASLPPVAPGSPPQ
jgi:uncharacterized RDD family membrane protein YckC